MTNEGALRSEVWWVELGPVPGGTDVGQDIWPDSNPQGMEIAKARPCVIISIDAINKAKAPMIIIVPMTRTNWLNDFHVAFKRQVKGKIVISYVMCDQVRAVARERLIDRAGRLPSEHMRQVESRLRTTLGL